MDKHHLWSNKKSWKIISPSPLMGAFLLSHQVTANNNWSGAASLVQSQNDSCGHVGCKAVHFLRLFAVRLMEAFHACAQVFHVISWFFRSTGLSATQVRIGQKKTNHISKWEDFFLQKYADVCGKKRSGAHSLVYNGQAGSQNLSHPSMLVFSTSFALCATGDPWMTAGVSWLPPNSH